MTPEDVARRAADTLNNDPELSRRNREMHALLDRAQTIADMVQAYQVGCMPSSASLRQVQETEQAMYAASHMVMQLFLRKAAEGGDAAQLWTAAVMQECAAYATQRLRF